LQLVDASVTAAKLSSTTGTGAVALASLPTFTTTIGVGGATASASGSGITFPATQSASSDANTLDDYEEGTWTPTLNSVAGGSASVSILSATYTKIGRFVSLQFDFQTTSSFSGGASPVYIGGLPFSLADGNSRFSGAMQYQDAFSVPNGVVVVAMSGVNPIAYLACSTSQSATTTFNANVSTSTYLGSSRYVQGSIVYETA
jgi:hypothetical protein